MQYFILFVYRKLYTNSSSNEFRSNHN